MSAVIWWVVLGLLIGWLIEWVIDWVYWRGRSRHVEPNTADSQLVNTELARLRNDLVGVRSDNQRLQAELKAATALAQQRQEQLDLLAAQASSAGATAQQPPTAQETAPAPVVLGVEDERSDSVGKQTIQLSSASLTQFLPAADSVTGGGLEAAGEQPLEEREVSGAVLHRRDPLIDINGIGPAYEQKLFDAGVYTFEALATMTAEQVIEIIAPQSWQSIDAASWIDQARALARKKVAL
jgi:predicted flap endonuclease-1-like 5' DNA nuclease